MTPEIIERVDVWLMKHGPESGRTVFALYGEWIHACTNHNRQHGPAKRAAEAALTGILLALVREAWGDLGAHAWLDPRTGLWCWAAKGCLHSVWIPHDEDGYQSEAEALAAALEVAEVT